VTTKPIDWEKTALRHVCPFCGAESGHSCTTESGAFTMSHNDRIQFVRNCISLAVEALPGESLLDAYRRVYLSDPERKEPQ